MKRIWGYVKKVFYIDYGTLDEENREMVFKQFTQECINRVNLISAISFIGESILMLLDFVSGFFRDNSVNYMNLVAEFLIIIASLIINMLCNKMVKPDYDNPKEQAKLLNIYKLIILVAIFIFMFTDVYVREKTLGAYIVFLFVFLVLPYYNAKANICLYCSLAIFVTVLYHLFTPAAPGSVLFNIWTIIFSFAFSAECMRSFSIKKTINDRMNTLMTERFSRLASQTILALSNAVEAKDLYTKGHSQRVAKYSVELARRMGYSDEQLDEIYYIGLLHDIGKIGVSDAVINKTGRLTDEEFAEIKKHPLIGYDILKSINEIPGISIGAKLHHEKYDGTGYPDGLKGENIPKVAQIIAMADSYDAMTSTRSYRDVMPQSKVRNEIERNIGTQFAPDVAKIMLQMMDEDKEYTMQAGAK